MGSAIEDAWDGVTGWAEDTFNVKNWERDPFGTAVDAFGGPVVKSARHAISRGWADIGGAKAWENATGMLSGDSGSYDLSTSGSSSACGGGACSKAADETKIPAVAQSISGDAAQAVEAQGTARKRARGIMQTYTRYDSSGIGGKSKLGE